MEQKAVMLNSQDDVAARLTDLEVGKVVQMEVDKGVGTVTSANT